MAAQAQQQRRQPFRPYTLLVVAATLIMLTLHGCDDDPVDEQRRNGTLTTIAKYCQCSLDDDNADMTSADCSARQVSSLPADATADACPEPKDGCTCVLREVEVVEGRLYSAGSGSLTATLSPRAGAGGASGNSTCDWSSWPVAAPVPEASKEAPAAPEPAGRRPDPEVALHYQRVGLSEHASVASFASAAVELMHLGAPAALVDRTLAAAREEVQHARMAFAIARTWSPEAFDVDGIDGPPEARGSPTLPEFVRRTALEACAGETPAVLRAAIALGRARDPQAVEYLRAVLAEERRHAELAWATVAWAVAADDRSAEAHGAARRAAVDALTSAASALEAQAATGSTTSEAARRSAELLEVGILSAELKAEAMRIGARVVRHLLALVSDEQLPITDLPTFEATVQGHFDEALAEAHSGKASRVESNVI